MVLMRPSLAILATWFLMGCGSPLRAPAVLPSVDRVPERGKAHLVGVASDMHDRAFSYAKLSLWSRIGTDTLVKVGTEVADSLGGFVFRDVMPGRYTLEAQFIGTPGARQAIWLTAGAVDTVNVRLHDVPATIPPGH